MIERNQVTLGKNSSVTVLINRNTKSVIDLKVPSMKSGQENGAESSSVLKSIESEQLREKLFGASAEKHSLAGTSSHYGLSKLPIKGLNHKNTAS